MKILQTFIPTFIDNSKKLVDDLFVNIGTAKEFDLLTYTTKSALNMICGELKVFEFIAVWKCFSNNFANYFKAEMNVLQSKAFN